MEFVIVVLAVGLTTPVAFYLGRLQKTRQLEDGEKATQKLLEEAEKKAKEMLLEAKEKAIQERSEAEREAKERRKEVEKIEQRLESRELSVDKKLESLDNKEQQFIKHEQELAQTRQETQTVLEATKEKLLKVANMTREDAREQLLSEIESEVKDEALRIIREVETSTKEEADKKAQAILVESMERMASEATSDYTSFTFTLPSDEMKGRIIGREGRNVRTLEQLTGVTFTIDDTPECITISSFDPIRREVARMSLERLIKDGRIHPARIEETVEKCKRDIAKEIKDAGEAALFELGLPGIPTELIKIVGRLKFRTSYGQNVLNHSIEVAHLAAMIAAEMKANVQLAKKAGFFHDIGKAVDHEVEGGHALIGKEILERFDFPPEICHAVGAHHYDIQPEATEDHIVIIADSISGARPGARRTSREEFIRRVQEIEKVANSFPGVKQSYAIHAGREIRVLVDPEVVDDLSNIRLARSVRDKIQDTLKYPGTIKVVCIRESRVTEVAQ